MLRPTSRFYIEQIAKKGTSKKNKKYNIVGFSGAIDDFIGIGFELEFDADNPPYPNNFRGQIAYTLLENNTDNEYFIERDSSLGYGYELISQPHTIDALRLFLDNKMTSLLEKLKQVGAENHCETAGLHIHISKKLFGETTEIQQDNVAKLWWLISSERSFMEKLSNRKFFLSCDIKDFNTTDEAKEFVKTTWESKKKEDKYYAINCKNKDTIEFRLPAATTDINELKFVIELYWFLANKSTTIAWDDLYHSLKWFENMPEICKERIDTSTLIHQAYSINKEV